MFERAVARVALDGVDLTVTAITDTELSFNVMPETYRQTTIRRYGAETRVNLERSLRAQDRLSGHIVRGVVEGTGTLLSREHDGDAIIPTYDAPPDLLERIVDRGPVCVDGVSLTVIRKTPGTFTVRRGSSGSDLGGGPRRRFEHADTCM